ncbi:hypothetical protein [Promicromonospora sp. NPDC023987]|uniref:MinD/ParA family ATP-binding protein n=1 Tax=Promicromonospora sp. NPDC023987 TaxID=3155360 RepID=UPI00340DB608
MAARTPDTLRAVLPAAVLRGAGRTAQDAAAWDSALRAPVGTSRRVTFLAADGGAGTTTLAAAVALALAHRRTGPVLALDAAGGPSALRVRLDVEDVPPLDDVAYGAPVRSLADAREITREARPGLHLAGASGWALHPAVWTDGAAALGRFFEVVVTDAGRRSSHDATTLAARSHATAVVARTDAGSFAAGRVLADTIRDALPEARVELVLVGVAPGEPPFVHGERPGALAIPHDLAAARSLGTPLPQLAAGTRAAVVHAAAHLISEARSA